ncbi:hypothetical protein A3K55_02135 [Candidatus Shapirobacteria bacterium RBG_13_44_7]|uniref:Uncharacterized protein n=1 Tax=Candidatus Shapirobacteria bacterium RBG_13_44_7 TaxID=1802149 RepID=A0A1F7SI32_9BACT|nr:MAG: hypothetical protein A3K55_02135 [Candidatus Shapirobacteria bacterium RBG_13_44_7]
MGLTMTGGSNLRKAECILCRSGEATLAGGEGGVYICQNGGCARRGATVLLHQRGLDEGKVFSCQPVGWRPRRVGLQVVGNRAGS